MMPLNNGFKVPAIGLAISDAKPADLEKALLCAVDAEAVGTALQMKFAYGSVKREDMFITSKLWCNSHGKGKVRSACEESLKKLKLKFLDLYLIQWPTAFQVQTNTEIPATGSSGLIFEDIPIEETWKEMEKLVDAGLVKSIGVCNFNETQIERIEISVNFMNEHLVEFAHSYGIQVTAYAPLGSPAMIHQAHLPSLLEEDFVKDIARAHFKSPAQVLLRHAIQRDLIVIPTSVNPERIRSNLNIFDFELKPEEMDILNSKGRHLRLIKFPEIMAHPEYPFKDELEQATNQ
nr:unnamed protein product [Spirometra erinaceieuropaei]